MKPHAPSRHVYFASQLAFDGRGCESVHYDDGNRVLLVVAGRTLLRNSLSEPGAPASAIDIGGGPVLGARFSLDGRVLAVQRSDVDIEFFAPDQVSFWQRCRRAPGEKILAFFWAASAGVDFVIATTGGLELYELAPPLQALRLVEDRRKPGVAWATYSHETRLAVLGCGPNGSRLFGFQFTGTGRIKLPKFELPPVGRVGQQQSDVRLLTVYGRLFCAHIDTDTCTLVLYRFYRDALLRQHSFPVPSARVAISVVDNALVVITLDTGVGLILDVLSGSVQPLASPLPLGLLESLPDETAVEFCDVRFFAPDLAVHRCVTSHRSVCIYAARLTGYRHTDTQDTGQSVATAAGPRRICGISHGPGGTDRVPATSAGARCPCPSGRWCIAHSRAAGAKGSHA